MNGVFLTGDIHLRLTPEERKDIQKQTYKFGLLMSEYVRRFICGCRISSKIEKEMLSELRRQGGLLKYVFNESRGMYSEKMAGALYSINFFVSGLEKEVLNDSETFLRAVKTGKAVLRI